MPNGYVLYDGPSLINGERIIYIVLVSNSKNSKTGAMDFQTIVITEHNPLYASKHGLDEANCGNCKHRGTPTDDPNRKQAKDRTCYVKLFHTPLIVWKQWKKGAYPYVQGHDKIASIGRDKKGRDGTYGDGGAVPSYVRESLFSESIGSNSYCHQYDNPNSSFNPNHDMVSADDLSIAQKHWDLGHRTFRVIQKTDELIKGTEILCPASKEMGRRVQCSSCMLCGGNKIKAKSIAIVQH